MKLLIITLLVGLSLTKTARAQSTSDEQYGKFLDLFKRISYEGFCNTEDGLSCIKGPIINIDNNCQIKVKPFIDACMNSYDSGLRVFSARLANKDFLASSELTIFFGEKINPCIKEKISVAQGKETFFVEQCFDQKKKSRNDKKAKQAKQLLIQNSRRDNVCPEIDNDHDLNLVFEKSNMNHGSVILFITASWAVMAKDDYNFAVTSDAFSKIRNKVDCFKVNVTNDSDSMLSSLNVYGVPAVVIVKDGLIFKTLNGSYKNSFSKFIYSIENHLQ